MDPVSIEFIHQDSDHPMSIKISWSAPYDNSETITGYTVMIYGYPGRNEGTFVERNYATTSECDGFTEPVFSQLYCYIQVTTLRAEPFAL